MMLLTLLLFGDFTYMPPAGKWLDYSRSMPLSANRHLIVEHSGPVNDHSTAGSQKILDHSGKFLYEINSAQGAWFLYNGVVGSEDTFFYQKHPSRTDRRNPNPVKLRIATENNGTPKGATYFSVCSVFSVVKILLSAVVLRGSICFINHGNH